MKHEGKQDILAFEELYQDLVKKYYNITPNENTYFYDKFMTERSQIPKSIEFQKRIRFFADRREFIDYGLDQLCKMENALIEFKTQWETYIA